MTISPCAMLMTPMTPKVTARPSAASSSTEPRERPWNSVSAARRNGEAAVDGGDGGVDLGGEAGVGGAGFEQQRARVRAGGGAERGDGGALRVLVGGDQAGGGERQLHLRADARHLLARERRFQQRHVRGVAAAEHRFGGGQALGRIGRDELQAAERAAERDADAVVERTGSAPGGAAVAAAGRCRLPSAALEQPAVGQGAQHGHGARVAEGAEPLHRLGLLVEVAAARPASAASKASCACCAAAGKASGEQQQQ